MTARDAAGRAAWEFRTPLVTAAGASRLISTPQPGTMAAEVDETAERSRGLLQTGLLRIAKRFGGGGGVRAEKALTTVHPVIVPELVTLPQEIDVYNAPRVCHDLTSALGEHTTVLIADMLLTEFCDSTGIRYLLIADKAAAMRGAELRVVVQSRAVLTAMRALGVDHVLKIYHSVGAAISGAPLSSAPSPTHDLRKR